MTNAMQSRALKFSTLLPALRAALALAVALLPVSAAIQSAQGQTFTLLHTFTGQSDGAEPFASLVQDAAGNLYSATAYGGNINACSSSIPPGCGVVYRLDANGTQTVLHTFTGPPDGANPTFTLLVDASGNIYGTAGGGSNLLTCFGGCGVVFKLDSQGNETVLYSFTGGADGSGPAGTLTQDAAGNLYGTTIGGGVQSGSSGFGVVYKLDPSGQETVLYSFTGAADGGYPTGGVIRDEAGNLYGTGWAGGAFNDGIVFKIDPAGEETVLYSFSGHSDGGAPMAGLIRDAAGNLYGTTEGGGLNNCFGTGCGVVFKLDPTGKETVLHSFSGPDGALPELAGLVLDPLGNLYGVTYIGGTTTSTCPIGCGVIYKVDASGNETVLYNFTGTTDGADPSETLFLDQSGSLYGTALFGGSSDLGTAFKLAAPFSVSASALTPNTLSPGGSATSTVNVTPASGFGDTVTLTCSVQPLPALAPTCSINPASVTPGTPAKLTVSTTGPAAHALPFGTGTNAFLAACLPLIGLAVTVFRSDSRQEKRRARLSTVALICVLLAGSVFAASCSNSGGGLGASSGTPPGTYTIRVTGTSNSSALSSSTTTILTVQ
ncbi:MAG TPA: choice-of-anchor tandem repeat GloVer-containing protein [Terriglobales bacterium]|jgi:uncharacterized repeat protein (TIGR03803 family)|nr:choice-of-anchor tandem repeat GloVer-containing protein [Terriglobales bacterium]